MLPRAACCSISAKLLLVASRSSPIKSNPVQSSSVQQQRPITEASQKRRHPMLMRHGSSTHWCTHTPCLLISSHFFFSAAEPPAKVTGKSADACWLRRRGHAQSDVGGILDRNAGTGDCLQRMAAGIRSVGVHSIAAEKGGKIKEKIN